MTYAPVIIPTLNRYEHFKQCLDSLESCTGAEQTEVFIGLDFPPEEKYVEGWEKINAYLHDKEQNNNFKQLTVFRRQQNCGVMKKGSNISKLIWYVERHYDRYISSEDDNVFSPNFLEYINKGLEKYEKDESILAIVGYAHPYHFRHAENNHYRHNTDMSVWGYGTWVSRKREMRNAYKDGQMRDTISIRNAIKFIKHGWLRLYQYIYFTHKTNIRITDSAMTVYLIAMDKYVIIPTISKVRNIGWDLNGNSFKNGMKGKEKIGDRHNTQPIDTERQFEYIGDDRTFMDYNNRVAAKESDGYISFFGFVRRVVNGFIRGIQQNRK